MSDENKNTVNEPSASYSNFETRFDKIMLWFEESKEKAKQYERWLEESTKRSNELDKKLDKLAKMYGGISENNGAVAEAFFYRGLENRDELFGIKYDQIGSMEAKTKKLQGQYDIVLYNGDTIIVIEVKYKLHSNDVLDFHDRKLPNFKQLFKAYADKKIIGAVAGLSVPEESINLAKQLGLIVLTQSGENISVANESDFEPAFF